jgi:small ligand-binding sensory domain FIST
MPYAAALSEHPLPTEAVGEVIGEVLEGVGIEPDLAVMFVTAPHGGALEDMARAARTVLQPKALLAATAVSVVGGGREVEEQPGVTLWAGSFRPLAAGAPDAADATPLHPVRIDAVRTSEGVVVSGLPDGIAPGSTLLLLVDPFSTPIDTMLEHWADARPDLAVVGGLASAARGPGGNRLVLDGSTYADGAVGVVLPPGVGATSVVSQGCRPIGEPMIVTKAERQVIYELAGQPALSRLLGLIESLGPDERALVQGGLHVGCVIDESKSTFERGDFLIRNVIGADRDVGAIAVGDEVAVGATVQFQVRDADSADEDLRALLAGHHASGALVFTCNGRGTHLVGRPDHDAEVISDHVDNGAVAGMFCAGELGPVGGRSFLHGFTASVLLFDA